MAAGLGIPSAAGKDRTGQSMMAKTNFILILFSNQLAGFTPVGRC